MGVKNMEQRSVIAKRLREKVAGNSNHPRWGKTGLRLNGRSDSPVLVLTISAKVSRELADAYEKDWQYTCHVDGGGRIIFTPLPDSRL
jgi:hypothetical protein